MKIQCEYCKSMFDDTYEKCPNCGAPNQNVRRSTPDQPTTIEGLKEWYESKGLPPYETTRFFIGIDYKKPRAFGIYKDEISGNFIVYKNKDDGTRAVRYEGTDEAYAVNELHTRLKQEILQQKSRNLQNNQTSSGNRQTVGSGRWSLGKFLGIIIGFMIFTTVAPTLFYVFCFFAFQPSAKGYYMCNDEAMYSGKLYYHYGLGDNDWAEYVNGDWNRAANFPSKFNSHRKAKNYFLSEDYSAEYGGYDFEDSVFCSDANFNFTIDKGYYSYDDNTYYHMKPEQDAGWYVYNDDNDDWDPVWYEEIPPELQHQAVAQDFWYTPTWDSETQITDFETTDDYKQYQSYLAEEKAKQESSSSSSSSDSSYDWDSGSSWDSGSTDWGSDW